MAANIKTAVVDHNKSDGKPMVTFSPEFLRSFGESITMYDDTLDQLDALVHGKGFDDEYGICNCCYQMRYITPNDISTFINDLFKAISMQLIACDISDLEKFSVEMAKKFIANNTGVCVDRGNILAMSKYADPRVETLMDLLVQTENTFFDRCVYSRYEMKKRANDLKSDYEKINGMHFGATMKAVVKSLPEIIKKAMLENASFVCCNCDTVMNCIETFILFSVGLNSCMLTQMIGYCEPMTTYLRKEKKSQVTQESVSPKKYAPVYIVLTAGKTPVVSQAIKVITHSKWSHVSIAFDASLDNMYSYAMKDTEYASKSQGLRKESVNSAYVKPCDICVYGFYVPKKAANAMQDKIQMIMDHNNTKFDYGVLLKKAFKDSPAENKNSDKKICTSFVNGLLKEFSKELSDKDVPAPQEMKDTLDMADKDVIQLYEGPAKFYDGAAITTKMKQYSKEDDSKPFTEYVTEFCLVKTNDVNIRSRIPFDCNMRNIVLQDCTPDFKDTRSALFFMLKNTRSPIHAMVIEAASEKRIAGPRECVPDMQMFEPYFRECIHNGPLGCEYDRAGFITDVNWLDKIAYGNNFLDGNYRMDAMGNETRHPILITLQTLHKMYCGCNLKTNEDLANNILKIAGIMIAIIDRQPWVCCNKDLVKDILAVLGECFTRNVIRLYNNHCNVIVYSDDMNDTMIPGYAYCESFVFNENDEFVQEAEGEKPAPAGVTFDQKTVQKTAVLGKLMTLIRQFGRWIQEKIGKIPALFDKVNGGKINWVQKHTKLNGEITDAIAAKTFSANLTNFPLYNIPAKDITTKLNDFDKEIYEQMNSDQPLDKVKLKAALYPGKPETALKIAQMNNIKEESEAIRKYVLFGNYEANESETAYNGALTTKIWNDMCSDLVNSKRLIDEIIKPTVKSLNDTIKSIEKQYNLEQKAQKSEVQQNSVEMNIGSDTMFQESEVNQEGGSTPPAGGVTPSSINNAANKIQQQGKAQALFDLLKEVSTTFQNNMINALTNAFFNTYYTAYKQIVDKYQSTKRPEQEVPQQQQQQTAETPEGQK